MRLIDADALREAHGMSADCESCPRNASWCGARTIYTLMDFCSWIDEAPTIDPKDVLAKGEDDGIDV